MYYDQERYRAEQKALSELYNYQQDQEPLDRRNSSNKVPKNKLKKSEEPIEQSKEQVLKPSNRSFTKQESLPSAVDFQQNFSQAVKAFRMENYPEVVRLLTPFVEEYPYHIVAIKMLGFAQAAVGEYESAFQNFRLAFDINRNDLEVLNALAYFEIRKGNIDLGINYLLDAEYLDKNNFLLKRNLEKVRKSNNPSLTLSTEPPTAFLFISSPQLTSRQQILHQIRRIIKIPFIKYLLIIVLVLLAVLSIYRNYPSLINWLEAFRMARLGKSYSDVSIQDIDELTKYRQKTKIAMTEEQAKKQLTFIQYYLENNQRNKAVIALNEIIHSTAPELLKERAIIMQSFIPDPDPLNIDFIPHSRDVLAKPYIYDNVYVRWNGTIANLKHIGRDETTFELLINFVDHSLVEGIALVKFNGFHPLRNGDRLSVFGTLKGRVIDNRILLLGDKLMRLE